MCFYCDIWGEGETWFLNPRNYSRHMYTVRPPRQAARQETRGAARESGITLTQGDLEKAAVDAMEESPEAFQEASKRLKEHMEISSRVGGFEGQVLTLQEADKVLELASPIGLLHCICRTRLLAKEERNEYEYTCLGTGVGMLKWERWPERYKGGVKFVNVEQGKEWSREMNKRGYVPIIMVYGERFVGGVCMCDYPACGIIAGRLDFGSSCLKGHYVAMVDEEKCNGCGICAQRCQWGALKFNVSVDKAGIDQYRCFGCGLCETACPRKAIILKERITIPALKEVW